MRGTHWPASGCFGEEVAGASYCAANYRALWSWPADKERTTHALALLRPDPSNEHDGNAIQVLFEDRRLGFLSRESARLLHDALGEGGKVTWDTTAYSRVTRKLSTSGEESFSTALDLDFRFPPRRGPGSRPRRLARLMTPYINTFGTVRGDHFLIFAPETPSEVVTMCTPGMEVTCWSPPSSETIYLFAPGSVGGSGKIGVIEASFLRRAGFDSPENFIPVIHSASGNTVILAAELPHQKTA